MTVQGQSANTSQTPILIYIPGLGGAEANSADRLAEVVARVADRLNDDMTFGTRTLEGVSAPRGLTVGKTIVDASDQPKLQLFQFNYASLLEISRSTALPAVAPGMFRSAALAVWATLKWFAALDREAKTPRTKMQLLLGLAAAMSLIFVALMALYALLVAMGVNIPWLAGVLGTDAATWTFGVTSVGFAITWTALRKKILALADTAEKLIRFVKNHGRTADTISVHLDQAIDGLRANGWKGSLHLLGYSFGSLILFEAMYPRVTSHLSTKPVETVSSLVTIGCPLDLVRLYDPSYDNKQRHQRSQNGAMWTNVFNAADIFASNLRNDSDYKDGSAQFAIGTVKPTSIRYLDETIGLFQIFMNGRTHAGYWGLPDEASCFDGLVPRWMPLP